MIKLILERSAKVIAALTEQEKGLFQSYSFRYIQGKFSRCFSFYLHYRKCNLLEIPPLLYHLDIV